MPPPQLERAGQGAWPLGMWVSAPLKGPICVGPGVGGFPGLLWASVSLSIRWDRESQQGASGAVLRMEE